MAVPGDPVLGRLLRAAREGRAAGRRPTRDDDLSEVSARLRSEHGLSYSPATLRALEDGRRPIRLPLLLALHEIYTPGGFDTPAHSRLEWVRRWLMAQGADEGTTQLMAEAVERGRLRTTAGRPTLADGIEAFLPLTLVVGDRREWPARSAADMFVESSSAGADLSAVPALIARMGTPRPLSPSSVELTVDKELAVSSPGRMAEALGGRNLLVVGSPAVNLATRDVNPGAPFHFEVPEVWQKWERWVQRLPALDDPTLRLIVWDLVRSVPTGAADIPDAALREAESRFGRAHIAEAAALTRRLLDVDGRGMRSLAAIMSHLRTRSIVDPVAEEVHSYPRQSQDFALVSLAPHPYDDDRVAILVAGMHGLGTASAMRSLSERPEVFARRPMGAVMAVDAGGATWRRPPPGTTSAPAGAVQTPEYTVADLYDKLAGSRSSAAAFQGWPPGDLRKAIELIRRHLPPAQ